MKEVNINKEIRCKTLIFPDKQPHINVNDIEEGDEVHVVCSIKDANSLVLLLECSNALDNLFAVKKTLSIPYLMGARFDRLMQKGDSVDLKVIANLINSCGFEKIYLYDVHSDTATALINKSVNITNDKLVKMYNKEEVLDGFSKDSVVLNFFEDIKGLEWTIDMIKKAIEKPVIDLDNFPKEYR